MIDPGERFRPSREEDERMVRLWDEGGKTYVPKAGDLVGQQVHRRLQRAVAAARKRLAEPPPA